MEGIRTLCPVVHGAQYCYTQGWSTVSITLLSGGSHEWHQVHWLVYSDPDPDPGFFPIRPGIRAEC